MRRYYIFSLFLSVYVCVCVSWNADIQFSSNNEFLSLFFLNWESGYFRINFFLNVDICLLWSAFTPEQRGAVPHFPGPSWRPSHGFPPLWTVEGTLELRSLLSLGGVHGLGGHAGTSLRFWFFAFLLLLLLYYWEFWLHWESTHICIEMCVFIFLFLGTSLA